MNLDDASLFLDAMGDVQPLKSHTDVHWQPMRNLRTPARIDTLQLDNFLSTGFLDIVPLSVPLEFRREGLQNGVTDKLRNGIRSRRVLILFANLLKHVVRCSLALFCRRSKKGCVMCW